MSSPKDMRKSDQDCMREILAAVRAGSNLSEACRKVGIRRDNRLKVLRRKYSDFDNALKEYRWGAGRTTNQAGKDKTAYLRTPEKEWGSDFEDKRVESFLLTYRDTNDMDASARASGFLPSTVQQMLDPQSKKFHAEFARAMREEEIRKGWKIRDDLERQASAGDAISQRWWLERRLPEFGHKAKSATDSNDMKYNADTMKKTLSQMKDLIREIRNQSGVAQSEEQGSRKATVAGSTPVTGSIESEDTDIPN